MNDRSCAASDKIGRFEEINFKLAEKYVKKLQKRIARAQRAEKTEKVEVLQHQLIHSYYAKALAVKIVTTNRGKNTPGIDNVLWKTNEEKSQAIQQLKRRGYTPKPLKRIYIAKSHNGKRPLSIPTMRDRAMQTLYRLALEPVAEVTGDEHSYGYRHKRSTRDAIMRCVEILEKTSNPQWILKADIKSCFDNIDHAWIMENIPIDKVMLAKFIKNGYIEDSTYHRIERGVPQGGSISAIIANMVLDGLENQIKKNCNAEVEFIRYADDIIVICKDEKILKKSVISAIGLFLKQRGLWLSMEKTIITRDDMGFDFLGYNVKRCGEHIRVTPSVEKVNVFMDKVMKMLDSLHGDSLEYVVSKLKPILNGWINYYKGVVVDYSLYEVERNLCSAIVDKKKDIRLSLMIRSFFPPYRSSSFRTH